MNTFFLIFIALPVFEVFLLIKIGGEIGALNTIALILLTAIVGIFSIITFLTKTVNWKNRNIIQEDTIEENFQKND